LSESVRAVERALDVLLCFSVNTPVLSMTQIAERVGMNKSTVHRLLATLEAKRFVERDANTGLYRPGRSLLQMAFLTLEKNNLRTIAAPYMVRLNELHRETITLAALDETEMVYLAVDESPQTVKIAAKPGQRLPIFCTASGKAVLAFSSEDFIQRILDQGLTEYTPQSICNPDTLREVLKTIRERGFAYTEQEFEEGINAVSAPILDEMNQPVGAISLVGPVFRMPVERMLGIGPLLVEAVSDIARELKFTRAG